jgi:hypothetical protein
VVRYDVPEPHWQAFLSGDHVSGSLATIEEAQACAEGAYYAAAGVSPVGDKGPGPVLSESSGGRTAVTNDDNGTAGGRGVRAEGAVRTLPSEFLFKS